MDGTPLLMCSLHIRNFPARGITRQHERKRIQGSSPCHAAFQPGRARRSANVNPMRVLGLPIYTPRAVVTRAISDIAAVERLVRSLPDQLERGLAIGDELVVIGHQVLEVAERLDDRAGTFNDLGERLDVRAGELLELGQSIRSLGDRIDDTGVEIVERAGQVVNTAAELITLLPAMERALDLASPLGGAIDRFGRMVDRFPGAPSPEASRSSEAARCRDRR